MPSIKKRASIHTLGCRLNQSESSILENKLRAAGYELVPFGTPADLGIVNSCTVTHEADVKSRKLVRQFIRKNPSAQAAVIGCSAQTGSVELLQIAGLDLIVGNQDKLNVLDYVQEEKRAQPLVVRDKIDKTDFTIDREQNRESITRRANLKIQDGCDFMCSFCVIPFARGRARSRALPNLLEEARLLVGRGAKELVLTGVNIGTYTWEGNTLLDVVEQLGQIPGLRRLRISSIEPTTIPRELFQWMADPQHSLQPYLHIPLQSGSNAILQAMRRRYTREEYLDFLYEAHEAVPGIGLGTDILVAFPGETDDDFEDTRRLLWESPLFYAHVFKYSERAGTAACRLSDQVTNSVAHRRGEILRATSIKKTQMFLEHHLGQELEVLAEHQSKGVWEGYTGNYLRARLNSSQDLTNQLIRTRASRIENDYLVSDSS